MTTPCAPPRYVPATKCAALAVAAWPHLSMKEIAAAVNVSERTARRAVDAAANGESEVLP